MFIFCYLYTDGNAAATKAKKMIDLSKYTVTGKTITFGNGKTFDVWSKNTKAGARFFYYSPSNKRMMSVAKKDIK